MEFAITLCESDELAYTVYLQLALNVRVFLSSSLHRSKTMLAQSSFCPSSPFFRHVVLLLLPYHQVCAPEKSAVPPFSYADASRCS